MERGVNAWCNAAEAPVDTDAVARGIVVDASGAVLLVRHVGGSLGLPGGHIRERETPYDAAIREVLEETGWECVPGGPVGSFFTYDDWDGKPAHFFTFRPVRLVGSPDHSEVLDVLWFGTDVAIASTAGYVRDLLKYALYG